MGVGVPFGPPKRHRDPDWLRLYHHRLGQSVEEMAAKIDADASDIERWMKKYGIEIVNPDPETNPYITGGGYDASRASRGRGGYSDSFKGYTTVNGYRVHRLTAMAYHGVGEVGEKVVHHRNGYKYDNRPTNLVPLSHGEHSTVHKLARWRRYYGPVGEWEEKYRKKRGRMLERYDRDFILQLVDELINGN